MISNQSKPIVDLYCKVTSNFYQTIITDDLTKIGGNMLYELKQDDEIVRAYSIDGKITCVKTMEDGEEKRFRINSPDDLFTIGWTEEKVNDSGLYIN